MTYYTDPLVTLLLGDCLEVMQTMPANSVDAVVTDPPYGLEFMGKDWDSLAVGKRMAPKKSMTAGEPEKGNPWASERTSYGVPKRNPRCRRCGLQKFNHPKSRCSCESPDWDLEGWHHNYRMQEWHEAWAREAFRLLKPGGHLLAFGGTRTYHRLASAIEDAGFEIRDTLVWAYASGFPKSLDVSKALDKAAGAEREKVPATGGLHKNRNLNDDGWSKIGMDEPTMDSAAPATDLAKQWSGWGTALKPAWEPIVLARKPLIGSVARNVTEWGTGGLNIDGTRIGYASEADKESAAALQALRTKHPGGAPTYGGGKGMPPPTETGINGAGRWPANVILTDPIFDGGVEGVVGGGDARGSIGSGPRPEAGMFGPMNDSEYPDSGGYSRFFIIPKADRAERERGLSGATERVGTNGVNRPMRVCVECGRMKGGAAGNCQCGPTDIVEKPLSARANVHPTVKPIDLMRHLVRLVTPPGGVVLDPFLGSGTTALAASEEGFHCIGVEREAEYLEIATGRLMATPMGLGLDTPLASPTKARARETEGRDLSSNRQDELIWKSYQP